MKNINYISIAEKTIQLTKSKGAFLVVESSEDKKINVMTIGWVAIGYMWGKPMMTVMVRKSRFTYGVIEKATSFTVSIPEDNLEEALSFCGTKSGRYFDKFKKCNLTTIPSKNVATPIVNIPGIHYECKIVYKSKMNSDFLCKEYKENVYSDNDYHTLYFGEIAASYKIS